MSDKIEDDYVVIGCERGEELPFHQALSKAIVESAPNLKLDYYQPYRFSCVVERKKFPGDTLVTHIFSNMYLVPIKDKENE